MKTKLVAVLSLFYFLVIQSQSYSQTDKFPFGVYASEHWYENYAQIKDMGANTIIQYAKRPEGNNPGNLESLLQFQSAIALNYEQNDYIHHYSGGYYKKWESEENILDEKSGVKHSFGEVDTVGNKLCWSTGNQTTAQDNFIFGPDYAQDKKYRQGYLDEDTLKYIVKINLRLETQPTQPVDVCRIRLVFKYYDEVTRTIETYDFPDQRVVNSSELSTSQFTDITMTYKYPEQFIPSNSKELRYIDGPTSSSLNYDDRLEGTGIQFVVDYLGGAKICVDYIEVYDEQIWNDFILDPGGISDQIKSYATHSGFNPLTNLRYWHSQDAPLSLDGYEPYRIIDAILDSVPQAKPIITDYYPMWNGQINGRSSFERWNTQAVTVTP